MWVQILVAFHPAWAESRKNSWVMSEVESLLHGSRSWLLSCEHEHERKLKWTGTFHKAQKGPYQTYFPLYKHRQTPQKGSQFFAVSNIGGTTWNKYKINNYTLLSIKCPLPDKLSAPNVLPDTPKRWPCQHYGRFGSEHILKVPHESKFKWTGIPYKVQKEPYSNTIGLCRIILYILVGPIPTV